MRLPTPLWHLAYRSAYTALRGYWFVRRPEVEGVKCVLTDGEHVLLVRHTYGHREWDLPGGAIRRGEPPKEAATREMHEELGVTVEQWDEIGTLRANVDHRRDNMHCYHAEIGDRAITMDRCELAAVRWFHRAQLPSEQGRFVESILAFLAA